MVDFMVISIHLVQSIHFSRPVLKRLDTQHQRPHCGYHPFSHRRFVEALEDVSHHVFLWIKACSMQHT
ncbi:hypothetical protein Plhal304r1_c016g0059131 [Plasmopara halstedii]